MTGLCCVTHSILTAWYCLWKLTPEAIQSKVMKSGSMQTDSSITFSINETIALDGCSARDLLMITYDSSRQEGKEQRS